MNRAACDGDISGVTRDIPGAARAACDGYISVGWLSLGPDQTSQNNMLAVPCCSVVLPNAHFWPPKEDGSSEDAEPPLLLPRPLFLNAFEKSQTWQLHQTGSEFTLVACARDPELKRSRTNLADTRQTLL